MFTASFFCLKEFMLKIVGELEGTLESEIISSIEKCYQNIQEKQNKWYKESSFFCPDNCGECCRNFEPDLLISEALYMAAWLIENQKEVAIKVCDGDFPFPQNKGCKFWNEDSPLHCTIYGGRPSICRLFGACANSGKNGQPVFKPCKFYPAEKLAENNPSLQHKQYSQKEILQLFNSFPPVMSDLMEEIVCIDPDNKNTELIHKILPEIIKRLLWILSMKKESD